MTYRGRWYPKMPPMLDGETPGKYTDRLTGADKMDRRPFDHERNRQCSIGYHEECSDPDGLDCQCPCHYTEAPKPRHDDPAIFVLHTAQGELYADGVCFSDDQVVYRIPARHEDDDPELHIITGVTKFKTWVERYGLKLIWIDQVPPELPDPFKSEKWSP
jgi:hypothetical protein